MAPAVLSTLLQATLILAGAALGIRRFVIERRRTPAPPEQAHPLPLWDVEAYAFAFAVLRAIIVTFGVQYGATAFLRQQHPTLDLTVGVGFLLVGLFSQMGLLLGLCTALWFLPRPLPPAPWETPAPLPQRLAKRQIPLAALETFLVTTSVVTVLTYAWHWLLQRLHVDAPDQEMVELLRASTSVWEPLIVVVLACLVAPVAEEGLFRGGLFRFCRGRLARPLAYLAPALGFAAVHFSLNALPGLLVLALLFSYAYERTGRIAVPMIAHALFNALTLTVTLLERNLP